MPVDKEELRRAVDAFNDDDFVVAQEILTNQFQSSRNDYIKNKLGLETDFNSKIEDKEDEEE
jgi:hypothetical protein